MTTSDDQKKTMKVTCKCGSHDVVYYIQRLKEFFVEHAENDNRYQATIVCRGCKLKQQGDIHEHKLNAIISAAENFEIFTKLIKSTTEYEYVES